MDNKTLNISDEIIENLSVEDLVDLKIEVDELLQKINEVLETCEETLNS